MKTAQCNRGYIIIETLDPKKVAMFTNFSYTTLVDNDRLSGIFNVRPRDYPGLYASWETWNFITKN